MVFKKRNEIEKNISPINSSLPLVKKSSGIEEIFSYQKLIISLKKAGATPILAQKILNEILPKIHDGISSRKIYQIAFRLLKKHNGKDGVAARYNLKRSIFSLGPGGYIFEKYISKLLAYQAYEVQTGIFIEGLCVKHEIDVQAVNEKECILIECKYHNKQGVKSGVQTPLYIHARFNDIKAKWKQDNKYQNLSIEGWIITNTQFSEDALQYGNCSGLRLISWKQVGENNLARFIEGKKMFPITCLTNLTNDEKSFLLENDVILCVELAENMQILSSYKNISKNKYRKIKTEIDNLLFF